MAQLVTYGKTRKKIWSFVRMKSCYRKLITKLWTKHKGEWGKISKISK